MLCLRDLKVLAKETEPLAIIVTTSWNSDEVSQDHRKQDIVSIIKKRLGIMNDLGKEETRETTKLQVKVLKKH